MELSSFFAEHPKVALGFSGGADSSYLLYAAKLCGADVRPYYVSSQFQPEFELQDAQRLCRDLGVSLHVLRVNVLSDPAVTGNPPDRCYHCKRHIFSAIAEQALADGYPVLLDGTNASDDYDDRPGMRALGELQVLSPLRLCGITKAELRQLSREAGLFTWDKPAYACLATRIPTGSVITEDKLKRIELSEGQLFEMGFSDFRIRMDGDKAKLQFPQSQLGEAELRLNEIKQRIGPYFTEVYLDPQGR